MADLFGSSAMAAGYASARPSLHAPIVNRIVEGLGWHGLIDCVLDVGCGAGLSTAPLQNISRLCLGMESMELMLKQSAAVAPGSSFLAGTAEMLPLRDNSVDLITAAGSLNYVELNRFFPEAKRVLRPNGVVAVYDFSMGRSFRNSDRLDLWYSEFMRRYPQPVNDVRQELTPEILASYDSGFQTRGSEHFTMDLMFTPASYQDYAMTETNVAHAIRIGVAEEEIRTWCADTLRPVFEGVQQEVLFRGYIACMTPGEYVSISG
jgi:SAM-dependent methyltransferase